MALAKQVLQYLDAHPLASDNEDGIRLRWLSDSNPSPLEVRAVLRELAAAGKISVRRLPDGKNVYCAKRAV